MADNNRLFDEFKPISFEEWHAQVIKDLKGADYERKVVWNTPEGFKLEPFYRYEDVKHLTNHNALPGEFPFVRGTTENVGWIIRQDFIVTNATETNKKALASLQKGADAVGFVFRNEISDSDFNILLQGIDLNKTAVHFISENTDGRYVKLLEKFAISQKFDLKKIHGSDSFDSLGYLLLHGTTPCGNKGCKCTQTLFGNLKNNLTEFKLLSIHAKHIHNAGGSIVQELGIGLAMGAEQLHKLTDAGFSIDEVAPRMQFVFALGSNYFLEVAKLRAARKLWAKITDAFAPNSADACKMHIHTETSEWNKTIYDPYVNILRATTEAMSGALGGADSVTVQPFDMVFRDSDDFSDRIARNIQIILKEEAHFDKVKDAASGSYYIEHLTDAIATEAWNIFLKIEEKGGFTEAFESEFIQNSIEEAFAKRKANVESRREILLGTNQYPNFAEKMKLSELKLNLNKKTVNDLIAKPIALHRASEAFEALRLKTDASTKPVKVFMLKIGNIAMRQARAQFSANFFGCAGFGIVDNLGYDSVADGVKDALAEQASIVVLCSSDDEYAVYAPEMAKLLDNKAIMVIAGNPACRADIEAAGISNFIHVKSNLLGELIAFQQKLGL